ncbi:hypothetical protein [Fodinibius saliphilus]|uniref:hypothetical protein n=1 Tax=Fodinibius saliphilus TaxID=1920650 RepID=UPI00110969D3|nr:hypothetical protein [Fodinibius saliphilus]
MNKKVKDWFDYFLHNDYAIPQKGLALYRIIYSAFFLLLGLPVFSWINKNPDIFFDPPQYSISALFSSFPPEWFFVFLDLSICILFFALLFGYKTKVVSILLTVLLIIGNSFRYSFGKIDHNIIVVLVPFFMSFSGWGNTLSLDAKLNPQTSLNNKDAISSGLPITILALLLGFGFFSAGYPKLFTWIDFDLTTQGVKNWVLRGFYILGRDDFLISYFSQINYPLFWEILDIIAVLFELGFLIAVFNKKYFRIFVGIAIFFHLNNLLMLNISFTSHLIIYLLFINWNSLLNKINISYISEQITIRKLLLSSAIYLSLLITFYHFNSNITQLLTFSPVAILLSSIVNNPSVIINFSLLFFSATIVFILAAKKVKITFFKNNV